jgi:hypothetical protein
MSLPSLHHVSSNAAWIAANVEKAAESSKILFTFQPIHTATYSKTPQSPP